MPYRWGAVEGRVEVEVAVNDDPAALGCSEIARGFLCGLGGELLEFRHEVRALLGFSWGFSSRDQRIEWFGPTPLAAADWDQHRAYLSGRYGEWDWKFASGFHSTR